MRNLTQSACETGFIANQLYAWRPEFPFGRGLLTPASTHRLCSSGGGVPPGSCNAAIEIGIGGAIVGVGASVELAFRGEIIGLLKATTGLCRPVRVRVPIATRSVDLRRGL
jgi:hypothetical protein